LRREYPGTTFGFNLNQYKLPATPADLANQAIRRPLYDRFDHDGVVCCNSDITSGAPVAHSNYNAMQTKLSERLKGGLSLQANYTWSKAMNNSTTYFYWDPSVTYSRYDLNRTSVFNLYGTYDLPFGKGKMFANTDSRLMNYLVGGWQLSGNSTWESGLPFTPTYAECAAEQDIDNNSSSDVLCRPNGSANDFPLSAPSFNPATHSVTYFTPGAPLTSEGAISGPFQRPGFGQFGNIGRNSFVGPREFATDASLIKNFAATERVNGQFQFQAFNVFNNPALWTPSLVGTNGPCIDCTTGTPGQITSLDPNFNMRQLQFAVRLSF
jgi:hypothetical protein